MWKVYHIQTGKIVRAGFENDDDAKDWMERRRDLADDDYDIEEMDEEEEEEYLENASDEEDDYEVGDEIIPKPLFVDDDDDDNDNDNDNDRTTSDSYGSEYEDDDSGFTLVDDEDL